jgi:His-Xaa-Ser system protein HxsD
MNGVSTSPEGHVLQIDATVYSLDAIKKTAYKFADRASVIIKSTGQTISVTFNFVGEHAKGDPNQVLSDFCNELLDQDLRDVVKKETAALRNVLIAHAFSRSSLAEPD